MMISRRNLIGAVIASVGLVVVMFAGVFGQLFTLSGAVKRTPAYGTSAIPSAWDIGSADAISYDAEGNVIDFRALPGRIMDTPPDEEGSACMNRTYVYEINDMKVWKKGTRLDSITTAISVQVSPLLDLCEAPSELDFSCAAGCVPQGDDRIIVARPVSSTLLSANAAAPGILQYVLSVNGSCMRERHCGPLTE
jgi:hypothetical protein